MSALVCVIASAELIFIKALFVGMMMNSVQGQFEIIKNSADYDYLRLSSTMHGHVVFPTKRYRIF
jgi:hypothetical protein